MKALALVLAAGGSLLAAGPAFAQQSNPGNQGNVPTTTQTAPPASQQGCMGQQGVVQHLSPQDAQQLSRQPEIQQTLNDFPGAAKDAIDKAASGGQLVGASEEVHANATHYRAYIVRNGTLFRMETDGSGRLVTWLPETD